MPVVFCTVGKAVMHTDTWLRSLRAGFGRIHGAGPGLAAESRQVTNSTSKAAPTSVDIWF